MKADHRHAGHHANIRAGGANGCSIRRDGSQQLLFFGWVLQGFGPQGAAGGGDGFGVRVGRGACKVVAKAKLGHFARKAAGEFIIAVGVERTEGRNFNGHRESPLSLTGSGIGGVFEDVPAAFPAAAPAFRVIQPRHCPLFH